MSSINELQIVVNTIADMPEEKFYIIALLVGLWLVVQLIGLFKKQGDKYDFHGDIYINEKPPKKSKKSKE